MCAKLGGDIRKSMCTTGINDTGVTGGKFCHWYRWCCYTGGNTLSSEYLREFSKKFELP
jgi:hypothetical protein